MRSLEDDYCEKGSARWEELFGDEMARVEQRQARAMSKALGISYTSALRQIREVYATADIKWKSTKK